MIEYVMQNWIENSADLDYSGDTKFSSIYLFCTAGEIELTVEGMVFPIQAGEVFDEGFLGNKTFSIDAVTGSGTWRGYTRGLR